MLTVLGSVLNLGNIAFEMDENEGAVVKEAHGPLRTAAVSENVIEVTSFSLLVKVNHGENLLKNNHFISLWNTGERRFYLDFLSMNTVTPSTL